MIHDPIATLEQELVRATDLSKVANTFFDCVETNPRLFVDAVPTECEALGGMLQQIGRHLFGATCRLDYLLPLRIESHRFVHGAVCLDGHFGTVIYFEDINMGLAAIALGPPSAEVYYTRFSATIVSGR